MRQKWPKYSVRALAIFITIACIYLGFWDVTKRFGIPAVENYEKETYGRYKDWDRISPGPFLVRVDVYFPLINPDDGSVVQKGECSEKVYYVWCGILFKYCAPYTGTK